MQRYSESWFDDIEANRTAFEEIPVLIIDDESDQASVNTVDPEKVRAAKREGEGDQERRAINERIAKHAETYAESPIRRLYGDSFANVFVDPPMFEGIFPKDFVICLSRPEDYMGVEDFHDFGRVLGDEGEIGRTKRAGPRQPP